MHNNNNNNKVYFSSETRSFMKEMIVVMCTAPSESLKTFVYVAAESFAFCQEIFATKCRGFQFLKYFLKKKKTIFSFKVQSDS